MTSLKKLLPFGNLSSKKQTFSTPNQSSHRSGSVQPVDVIDIDPQKLMDRLKLKFGSDFKIHVGGLLQYGEAGHY
jgi:hypothetical protein